MAKDRERIEEFLQSDIIRSQVATLVRSSGFSIERVHAPTNEDRRSWGLNLKKSKDIQQLFPGRREVLLWVSEYSELQARTISHVRTLVRSDTRLAEDFVILVSGDPESPAEAKRIAGRQYTAFATIRLQDVAGLLRSSDPPLLGIIQRSVYSRDLYRVSGAITEPEHFFGRESFLREMDAELRKGGSHVGLFGLRKMGKTSFLYRLLARLQGRSVLRAHIDLQRVLSINHSRDYFLWSLGQSLFDTNPDIRRGHRFRLFGRHSLFADISEKDRAALPELFAHDLRVALSRREARIVFFLDEVERMWPRPDSSSRTRDSEARTFVESWRLLRGIEQENAGRISFFLTGTNPRCLEAPDVYGEENPLHRYVERRFLPHLDEEAREELLVSLGKRMGLLWNTDALVTVFGQVGGHPSLLRLVGSIVHEQHKTRTSATRVTQADVETLLPTIVRELNPSLEQMMAALREDYPDDFFLLEMIADGRIGEFREYSVQIPDAVSHLIGYELVRNVDSSPAISFELLHTWLQRKAREAKRGSTEPGLKAGAVVGGYQVETKLSTGGFGAVYSARSLETGDRVALKVFLDASLEALTREVDVLKGLEHSNIVKFIDHGVDDGRVFLVLELLKGRPLSSACERSFRLNAAEVRQVARSLLEALAHFHPNEDKVSQLRSKRELSLEEYEELSAAREGYVHRDVKPENVILVEGRGPVLIDFGIASRVGPARTMKHTPGYLPPDFGAPGWSSDVDLYQLGLTLLQAWLGQRLSGEFTADKLRSLARAEDAADRNLHRVLLRLAAPDRTDRFRSAREALQALA